MTYEETLDFLFTRLPMYQRQGAAALKFNLDNITALMQELGNPQHKVKTIHVAGTNGKGSSVHMLSSILQEAGYTTGLYTSPHLKSFTERIRINGREISKQAVIEFVRRIRDAIEEIKPSFFEITFAMAMDYFVAAAVDIAIIEVGMGGRLDSTNIISPEICLITNISFDHQHLLGDTLEKIAAEKAGIIKENIPVVISQTQPEVAGVFQSRAVELGAPLYFADKTYHLEQAAEKRFNVIANGQVVFEGILPDLKGEYQKFNFPGVLMTCALLEANNWHIPEAAIVNGLQNVIHNTGLKGRWQQLSEKPLIIADTGHNEAGIAVIISELQQIAHTQLHIVWGMVEDKEVAHILELLPTAAIYYFVEPDIPRGLPAADLGKLAGQYNLQGSVYDSVAAGIHAAKQRANEEDCIFIGGSTFVVAEIDEL